MAKFIKGTVALIDSSPTGGQPTPLLRMSTDVDVLTAVDSADTLHHDYLVISSAAGLTELRTFLDVCLSARGTTLVSSTLFTQLAASEDFDKATARELSDGLSSYQVTKLWTLGPLRLYQISTTAPQRLHLGSVVQLEVSARVIDEHPRANQQDSLEDAGEHQLLATDVPRRHKTRPPRKQAVQPKKRSALSLVRAAARKVLRLRIVKALAAVAILASVYLLVSVTDTRLAVAASIITLLILIAIWLALTIRMRVDRLAKRGAQAADLARRTTKISKNVTSVKQAVAATRANDEIIIATLNDLGRK